MKLSKFAGGLFTGPTRKKVKDLLTFIFIFLIGHMLPARAYCSEVTVATDTLIRGVVLSDSIQQPVSMATVAVQGGGPAVKTDEKGRFAIAVSQSNAELLVSHVGYEQTSVAVNEKISLPLIISLKRVQQNLGEVLVVSTGYQTLPQERSTGSFSVVDSKRFNEQTGPDVLSRLEATANGFQVDRVTTGAGIIIRGLSTIKGPREPLIVVDNFPYEGDINNINPNDVENVTILKDAAASSVWGTKAGNGVIVITTKKAKFNQRAVVDFNANVTVTSKPDLSYIPQISADDLINTEIFLYGKGYFDNQLNDNTHPPISPVVEILQRRSEGSISAEDSASQIDALRKVDIRNDFNKYIYQRAFNQQYAIGVHGGSEKLAWRMGAGVDKDVSVVAAKYNRLNLRWENAWTATKNLRVMTSMYFTQSRNISGKPGYNDVRANDGNVPVYTQFADKNGNPLSVMKNYRQAYLDTVGNGKLLDWNYYPLTDYQHSRSKTATQDLVAKVNVNYRLNKALHVDLLYQYEREQGTQRALFDEQSFYTRDRINTFTQIDAANDAITYVIPRGGILDVANSDLIAHQGRAQLNYAQAWGDHSVTAIAGGELRQTINSSNSFRSYGYNDDILTFVDVDLANPYPNYVTGWGEFIPSMTGFTGATDRFVSTYLNAAYSYKARYTLSVSGRRDASNLFGVNTNDKWTPLWSSGLAWNVSDEKFYKSSWIPYLKLRATYGVSGNVDQHKSALTILNYLGSSSYTRTPIAYVDGYNNRDLRWEKVYMLNIGLDFKIRNNRVSGSVEYFRKNAHDLYGSSPIDYTAGLGTSEVIKNVATMRGSGVDLQLTTLNVKGRFSWSTVVNLSYFKDKVTKYYLSYLWGGNFVATKPTVSAVVGRPVYSVFSYKWAGLDPDTGNPRGYINGKPSSDYIALVGPSTTVDSLHFHGSALPTVFGSMANTFTWKGFSLTAAVVYKFGAYFRRESIYYSGLFSGRNGHSDFAARWQRPGDEKITNVPSMIYPAGYNRDGFYNASSVLVEKSDHIRLQYINFTYDIPVGRNNGEVRSKLQVYINASNLGIIWKKTKFNIDPDYPSNDSRLPKSFAAGVRVSI